MDILETSMDENSASIDRVIAKADMFTCNLTSLSASSDMAIVSSALARKLEEHFSVLYSCFYEFREEFSRSDDDRLQRGFNIKMESDGGMLKSQFIYRAGEFYVFSFTGVSSSRRDGFVLSHYFDEGQFNLHEMTLRKDKCLVCSCSNLDDSLFEGFRTRMQKKGFSCEVRRVSPYTGLLRLDTVVNDILDYDRIVELVKTGRD